MIHVKKNILIFLYLICGSSLQAKPTKFFDGLEIGISEKGANLNLINNISDRNQLTFGIHNFNGNISYLSYSLIKPTPILYSSKGIQFSFKRFITGDTSKSGLFKKFGLELSSLKASSTIDLSSQIYDLGGFTLTCRTCDDVIVETNSNSYKFIPSVLLGWQQKINQNFGFSISGGIQYYHIPKVKLNSSSNDNLPSYVQTKIDSILDNTNQELSKYGNIIPTISLSTYLYF